MRGGVVKRHSAATVRGATLRRYRSAPSSTCLWAVMTGFGRQQELITPVEEARWFAGG